MEPISITIITYVSLKLVDQFIKEEGYGRLKKFFFPSKKCQNRLIQIIYETINEFESENSVETTYNKFPFYHSKLLFDELNKYILFNNIHPNYNLITELLKTNSNILTPSTNDIESFYEIFTSKIKNDNNFNAQIYYESK